MNRPEDFQKFYFNKVGLGEGCGCAERVIDLHEMDRTLGAGQLHMSRGPGLIQRLRRWFSRSRHTTPDAETPSPTPSTEA